MSRLLPILFAAFALAGCATDETPKHTPAIHIEPSTPGRYSNVDIQMPVSGARSSVNPQPVVPEGNFDATEVLEVGDPLLRRLALLVMVDGKAASELYKLTLRADAQGKRLFLFVADKPVGVHVIEGPINGGNIFFDIEVPGETREARDKAIRKLCTDINASIVTIRRLKEKKK